LPLAHKVRHGAHGLLNGRVRVHAVLVVEVNDLDTETTKAGLTSGANVFRSAIDPTYIGIDSSDNAELGGQKHLVTAPPNRPPDQLFIRERAVDVGSVQKVDPQVECRMNRRH